MAKKSIVDNQTIEDILHEFEIDPNPNLDILLDTTSTGSILLDDFMEGGFRPGIYKFEGEYESGKSSQAFCWGREWQKKSPNHVVVYCLAEGKSNIKQLNRSGLSLYKEQYIFIPTNKAEKIFSIIEKFIKTQKDKRFFFIIDSLDGMILGVDEAKGYDESTKVGGQALMNSVAMRRLSHPVTFGGHVLYICAQLRAQINTMGGMQVGRKSSGGNAVNFNALTIGRMSRAWQGEIKDSEKKIGHKVEIKFGKFEGGEKSGESVIIPIKYGHIGSIWRAYEAFDIGQQYDYVKKTGSWYLFDDQFVEELKNIKGIEIENKKIQGETNFIKFLEENPEIVDYLAETIS